MSRVRLTGTPLAEQLRAAVPAAMAAAGREVGPQIVRAIQADLRSRLSRFSSERAGKIRWRLRDDAALIINDWSKTASLFETGGIVVPKRGRLLLIPFAPVSYSRRAAKRLRTLSFVVKTRRGTLVLMRRTGNPAGGGGRKRGGQAAVPVGILVTSARHLPRTRFEVITRSFAGRYARAIDKNLNRLLRP